MHRDTMQSVLRAAATVPESVAWPEPVVVFRFGWPDRRTLPVRCLAKDNRKEKGTNFVLRTYQFSYGGDRSAVTARFVMDQVAASGGRRDINTPNVGWRAQWPHGQTNYNSPLLGVWMRDPADRIPV